MEFKSLTCTSVYAKLKKLAVEAFDLTGVDALAKSDRLGRYASRSSLLNYHYATQRVDDKVLDLLQILADELELVSQFKAMRRGAVINRVDGYKSEDRQVLHTACRDIFAESAVAPEAVAAAKSELEKLQQFLEEINSGVLTGSAGQRFDTMIHVGIGGSDLGPRAMYEGLKVYGQNGRNVHFISNLDPDDAAAVLKKVDLATTLVAIVSKSGTTLETLTNEKIVGMAFEKAGLRAKDHCISITGEGSPMDNPQNYLRSFHMFDYIGGRFSSTSMVGGVVLSFYLGLDAFLEFLRGAATIDQLAEKTDIRENIPLLMAVLGIWNHNFLGYATLAVLPYSQALSRFPAHLQQCDMESNGKSVLRSGKPVEVRTGPLVWGEPGTNGQHAFYQLLHQGTEIVPVEFIGFKASQYGEDLSVDGSTSQEKLLANLYAQMVAMAIGQRSENPNKNFPGNRPSSLVLAEKLTPEVMGALLALYESKIVFQGFAWNINSFDQEGVQLGKVLADRFLTAMGDTGCSAMTLENKFLNQLYS
ncbi:MAG: glucose-6-phosphate isomerase [Desulfotalea sp.]|nr:MAG: glucose-6-phosphate isomerase [Desulfotalea sp.]